MVTGHKSNAAHVEIKRLKQVVNRLREDLQVASDQRDTIMTEYSCVTETAIEVAALATLDDANPDVYVVPAEQMNRLMFVLKGE